MHVDFIADVVCPWCYVGWAAYKRARTLRPAVRFETLWRPFLLNPDAPAEGVDRRAYYQTRFADDPERARLSRQALKAAAEELNAPLDLDAAAILPNTINAHRLIVWGYGQERGEQMIEALFHAYFVDGRNLADIATLAAIGASAGLDEDLLRELLPRDTDCDIVFNSHDAAVQMGVTGVPCLVFDNKAAAIGADKPEVYAAAVDKALAA